jgi:hypothetical protein
MFTLIQNIIFVYFTPFPYTIYDISTKQGNMAWAGVGLGLINSQRLFWISNAGIMLVIYNTNIYFDFILLFICGFLYSKSFKKTIELIKYLEI